MRKKQRKEHGMKKVEERTTRVEKRGLVRGVGVEHKKEIEGFHLPTASFVPFCTANDKRASQQSPLIKTNLHPKQMD